MLNGMKGTARAVMLSVNKPVPIWFIPVFALLVWGGQYVLRDFMGAG